MVTERHRKQPQMRGIGSNEAASRIDTRIVCDPNVGGAGESRFAHASSILKHAGACALFP